MNNQETVELITILASNYDNIANKDKIQKKVMVETWFRCLEDLEYSNVLKATMKAIIESSYPPTINEIRKNAIEMSEPNSKKTAIEAWNEAYDMICNGTYMTEEKFNLASPEVRKFFGNVRQVKELALTDISVVNTVTKGQFLKQYEIIVNSENNQKILPSKIPDYINLLSTKMNMENQISIEGE